MTRHTINGSTVTIQYENYAPLHLLSSGPRNGPAAEGYAIYCGVPSPSNRRLNFSFLPHYAGLFPTEAEALAWCEAHLHCVSA
jgi:hypothetical protein